MNIINNIEKIFESVVTYTCFNIPFPVWWCCMLNRILKIVSLALLMLYLILPYLNINSYITESVFWWIIMFAVLLLFAEPGTK